MKTFEIFNSVKKMCFRCYWYQNCQEPDYDCNATEIAYCTDCPFSPCSKCEDFDLFLNKEDVDD